MTKKVVIVGDIHFAVTPPERRRPEYAEQVREKLDFVAHLASKIKAEAVVFTGDVFHRKRESRNRETLREVNAMLDAFGTFEQDVHLLVGNHDVVGHNSDDLEGVGIGALFHLPHVHRISREPDGCELIVTGTDYCPDYEDQAPYDPQSEHDGGRPHIHVTHGMLLREPLGFDIKSTPIEVLMPHTAKNILFANGHWHEPWEDVKAGIWNVGSLTRAAISEQHAPRILVAVWGGSTWEVRSIPVPVYEDVWVPESEAVKALTADEIGSFVDRFSAEQDIERRSEALLEELLTGSSDSVRATVHELLAFGGTTT